MAVASKVVGQCYTTEIDNKLDSISRSHDQIRNIQNTALFSEIHSVIRETSQIAKYNDEIMSSDDERKIARVQVSRLEENVAKLLDQIDSLILAEMSGVKKFEGYQQHTEEILPLVSAQKALLDTLQDRIG
ncbi:hypothetical protein ACFQ5J_13460 [Lacticaseibacillus baoqingensis]|uniref:Uncharacterized protein n=1 Tax=Lacticaseibacillus baoqingensis TaxID=2486013 RepID=A0ABW4EB35_9LACO